MFKRILFIAICFFVSNISAFAESLDSVKPAKYNAENQAEKLIVKVKFHRNSIYETLDLTPDQTEEIQKLDQKLYQVMQPELTKLALLTQKLQEIAYSENCTKKAVNGVKKEFRAVEKDMNSIKNDYEKEFKRVLNSEQRSKYRKVRRQKRAELKKEMEREIEKHKHQQKGQSLS